MLRIFRQHGVGGRATLPFTNDDQMSRIVKILDDNVTQVTIAGLHVLQIASVTSRPAVRFSGGKRDSQIENTAMCLPRYGRRQNNGAAPLLNSPSTIPTLSRTPLAFASSDLRLQCCKRLVPHSAKCLEPRVRLPERALLDGVDATRAVGAHGCEPVVPQHTQMLRDGGLRDPELALDDGDDVTGRLRSFGQ